MLDVRGDARKNTPFYKFNLNCGVTSMAKSKRETVNKSQAIRDALEAHPNKSPLEIAEDLKAKGLNVNAQYVSTIKSNAKSKGRKKRIAKRGRPAGRASRNGLGPVGAALEFIRAAGGLEEAKHALQTVEEIRQAVR
jgi:hypothetical protein